MRSKIGAAARSGVAMMLVLALSVVILAVGMSMIGLSGNVMSASVDAKTKIKARYAAESSISASIANAVYQAGNYFGGSIAGTTLNLDAETTASILGLTASIALLDRALCRHADGAGRPTFQERTMLSLIRAVPRPGPGPGPRPTRPCIAATGAILRSQ